MSATRDEERDQLNTLSRISKPFVPTPAERVQQYRALGLWRGTPLGELLRRSAARFPDRVAVASGERAFSYRELEADAQAAAWGFRDLAAPGERVLFQLVNSPEFVIALFGALDAGLVPVMCLPGHGEAELKHFAEVSGAVARLTHDRVAAALTAGRARTAGLSPAQPDPCSPALLLVSGGTTGLPKLIPRTHDDYWYNAATAAQVCGLSERDVYLAALPAAHNFPLACPGILGILSVGGTAVFTSDPSPETAFEAIERHQVSVTALTPPLAGLWGAAAQWEPADLSSLRLLQVGGAKLEAVKAHEVQGAFGAQLQQVFGMAEGLVCFTRPEDPAELVLSSQGRPMSDADEVRLVDQDGAQVPDGVAGELETRGPYTISGYWDAPEANQRAFTADGFYRSGDLARRLPSGHLEVVGRIKDVINRGGETISAEEVEGHLNAHPEVSSAAAVACPDELLGEKICAAVVFRSGPVELLALREFLAGRGLSTDKHPELLLALASLPMTAAGKIDKRAIAAQLGRRSLAILDQ